MLLALALPGSVRPHQTNMHFGGRSYVIIKLTEVRDMLYVMYFATLSLWLSLLAKCKTFNVLYVGRDKYLSSIVNPIVAKQMYMMSELCHWYRKIFISQFNNFYTAKSWIYSATFTEIFVQIWSFSSCSGLFLAKFVLLMRTNCYFQAVRIPTPTTTIGLTPTGSQLYITEG